MAKEDERTTPNTNYRRVLNDSSHDGLFIPIVVGGISANCLIDTGSTISVLHPDKYLAIPEDRRPQLQPYDDHLVMGDGSKVRPLGKAKIEFSVGGNYVMTYNMVIAEVEVPAVLGYDFLKSRGAILDICSQKLMLNDHTFECILESRLPSLFRISLSDTVTIPARSEMMVNAELRSENG